MQALEPLARELDAPVLSSLEVVLAPAQSTAAILRAQRMNRDIQTWARGIDREQFNPERRDMEWRRSLGIADDELVIAFLGRIVIEKGLDVFSDAIHAFATFGLKHRVLVIGEGPARPWFEEQLPEALFIGQQTGADLARALASADVFLNPSVTEAFGNVTLEAMACALPVIAAECDRATNLVRPGITGTLVDGTEPDDFADALAAYARDPELAASMARPVLRSPARWTGTDQLGRDPRLQARNRQTRAAGADHWPLGLTSSRSTRWANSSISAASSCTVSSVTSPWPRRLRIATPDCA